VSHETKQAVLIYRTLGKINAVPEKLSGIDIALRPLDNGTKPKAYRDVEPPL
jgi:hypothetical protein